MEEAQRSVEHSGPMTTTRLTCEDSVYTYRNIFIGYDNEFVVSSLFYISHLPRIQACRRSTFIQNVGSKASSFMIFIGLFFEQLAVGSRTCTRITRCVALKRSVVFSSFAHPSCTPIVTKADLGRQVHTRINSILFCKAMTTQIETSMLRRPATVQSNSFPDPQLHELPYAPYYVSHPNRWAKFR